MAQFFVRMDGGYGVAEAPRGLVRLAAAAESQFLRYWLSGKSAHWRRFLATAVQMRSASGVRSEAGPCISSGGSPHSDTACPQQVGGKVERAVEDTLALGPSYGYHLSPDVSEAMTKGTADNRFGDVRGFGGGKALVQNHDVQHVAGADSLDGFLQNCGSS